MTIDGTPNTGRLEAGETRFFAVEATVGDLLRVEVEQRGVDVELTVWDPDGNELFWTDSPFAERLSERVLVEIETVGTHVVELRAFEDPGAGDYEMTVELRLLEEADRRRIEAFHVYGEAERANRQEDDEAAMAAYERAEQSFAALGDEFGRLVALTHEALLADDRRKYRRALDAYVTGLRLASTAGFESVVPDLVMGEGMMKLELGSPDDAAVALQGAAEGFAAFGNVHRQAIAVNELARAHERAGRLDEARRTYERAAELARKADEPDLEDSALGNAARICSRLGAHELALDLFTELADRRRSLGGPRGELVALLGRGVAERRLGQLDAAHATLREVWRRSLTEAPHLTAVVLSDLGQVELRRARRESPESPGRSDRLATAEELFSSALETYREKGKSRSIAHTAIHLAEVDLLRGDYAAARQHAEEALALYDRADRQGQARSFHFLAQAERLAGRLERAWSYSSRSLEFLETLREDAAIDTFRQSYLALRRDYVELAVDLAVELARRHRTGGAGLARSWLEKALAASERGRARSLLDVVRVAGLEPAADPAFAAREDAASHRLIELELERLRLEASGADPASIAEKARQIKLAALELAEIRSASRPSARDEDGMPRPMSFESAAFAARHLDESTALIAISLGRQRAHLFWLAGADLEVFPLPGRGRLDRLARLAHQYLEDSHKPSARAQTERLLRELSRTILAPLADRLTDQRLAIVAEGALQYLPFGVLPDPRFLDDNAPPRLIERHELVSLPSVSVLAALRTARPRSPAQRTIAVVADPVFEVTDPRLPAEMREEFATTGHANGSLDRLPHTAEEAVAILALVGDGKSVVARGFDANVDLFRDAAFADAAILHFATHGRLDAEQPELSGLELSRFDAAGRPRRGTLYAHELYGLSLRADLAVLSACRTALGREVRGEGLLGLTRGFFHAGVGRVVVSLWSVDDRATKELMVRFYRHLLDDGLAPAAALRAAQLELLSDERWRAPYHWAGFVLQGDWR